MSEDKKGIKSRIMHFYEEKYKILLIIPILLLVMAISQITYQTITTGDFLNKDVSLKGGMTITIPIEKPVDISQITAYLETNFPANDISVRVLSSGIEQRGIIISADISVEDTDNAERFIVDLTELTGVKRNEFSIEFMGSSLGESFFRETFTAILLAFLFMGVIVFMYFGDSLKHKIIVVGITIVAAILIYSRSGIIFKILAAITVISLIFMYIKFSIPSFAVILAALSDIIITLAIVNMMGMKLSTAGIAAFLMLIGYSVDTDILLSTRLLKRKEGSIMDRIYSAMKTGLTMNITTMIALTVGLILSQSVVISQIMIILLIGLCIDIVNTWIQNVGILRLYLEAKK